MAKKATTRKKTRKPRANSKSAAVRAYLENKPDAGPTEIAGALKKQGIEISPAHVSNVKATLKKAGRNGKAVTGRRGRPAGKGANGVVSLAGLLEARTFVDNVGGIESAGELLRALAKLQA